MKWVFGVWGAVLGLFVGVEAIMTPCLIFIATDFVLGVITDIKASRKRKEKFGIRSGKLWKTIVKVMGVALAIILTNLYSNSYIDWLGIDLGKMLAGVIAAVELYSILGHLVYITEWYGLEIVRSIFKKEIEDKVGHKIDEK